MLSSILSVDDATDWLLNHESPTLRYWALRDLKGGSASSSVTSRAQSEIAGWGPMVGLLSKQDPKGYGPFRRIATGRSGVRRFGISSFWASWELALAMHLLLPVASIFSILQCPKTSRGLLKANPVPSPILFSGSLVLPAIWHGPWRFSGMDGIRVSS